MSRNHVRESLPPSELVELASEEELFEISAGERLIDDRIGLHGKIQKDQ
jgi:hypothetical protein